MNFALCNLVRDGRAILAIGRVISMRGPKAGKVVCADDCHDGSSLLLSPERQLRLDNRFIA